MPKTPDDSQQNATGANAPPRKEGSDPRPKLDAKALSFGYDGPEGTPILKALSLSLHPGEMLALVGPNGCGKTTLLKQLSGVLTPTTGHVYLDGQRLHQMKPKDVARQLAALEQHIQVDFAFTVEQLVAMGRMPYLQRLQGLSPKDRAIVDDAMTRTGIAALRHRHIDEVSSGERQRVWLAMALAQEPQVLLLDEPASHLDIKYQLDMLALLRQLSRDGLAVAMSMHELHLLGQFADRVALIHQGQLHAIGPTQEVITPQHILDVFGVHVQLVRDPITQQMLGAIPTTKPA